MKSFLGKQNPFFFHVFLTFFSLLQQQQQQNSTDNDKSIDRRHSDATQEKELQLAKAISQIDHLRSQNDVLELTLDDAKTTSDKLSIHLARHESNGTAMQLALAYADQVKSRLPIFPAAFVFKNSHIRPLKLMTSLWRYWKRRWP